MSARAVGALRAWDARLTAEHGPDAVWAAVSHGDVIKAILADALGMHLDTFQRILVDPASISIVRYTADPPVRDHRRTPPTATWLPVRRRRPKGAQPSDEDLRRCCRWEAGSGVPRRAAVGQAVQHAGHVSQLIEHLT